MEAVRVIRRCAGGQLARVDTDHGKIVRHPRKRPIGLTVRLQAKERTAWGDLIWEGVPK